MDFAQTLIAKVRGGVFFDKLFTFEKRVAICLDDKFVPFLKQSYGTLEKVEKNADGSISLSTSNDKLQLELNDTQAVHSARPLKVNLLSEHVTRLSEILSMVLEGLGVNDRVHEAGIEIGYAIPFKEKRAISVFDEYFAFNRDAFAVSPEQETLQRAVQNICRLGGLKYSVKVQTHPDNESIVFFTDIRRVIAPSGAVDIAVLHDASVSFFDSVLAKKQLIPILEENEATIDWNVLTTGSEAKSDL